MKFILCLVILITLPSCIKVEKKVVQVKPKPFANRPVFMIKNKGIKPQDCSLPFEENGKLFFSENMKIYDYFKYHEEYHFAVSVNGIKFLLDAKDVLKEHAEKEDLDLALKFAKYCRTKAAKAGLKTPLTAEEKLTATINSRDSKNLSIQITQLEDAIKFHRAQVEKLNSTLRSKQNELSKHPRYTRVTNGRDSYGNYIYRSIDNSKSSTSKYNRYMSEVEKIKKKIDVENRFIASKTKELNSYKTQLAKLR